MQLMLHDDLGNVPREEIHCAQGEGASKIFGVEVGSKRDWTSVAPVGKKKKERKKRGEASKQYSESPKGKVH